MENFTSADTGEKFVFWVIPGENFGIFILNFGI